MDERFRQAYWDDHGIMRKMDEEMTSKEIRNYGNSLAEIEGRRSVRAVCPFCLYIGTMDKFTTLNDNKTVAALLTCPECGASMRKSTTEVFDRGPEAYSRWFWNKFYLSFKMEKERLVFENVKRVVREYGFSNMFWEIQKALKERYRGEDTSQQKMRIDGTGERPIVKVERGPQGLFKYIGGGDEDEG